MKIGVTGHQERPGIDWDWVRARINRWLASKSLIIGYSSLAAGADQVFADCILNKGGKLVAVIPVANYRDFFTSPEALVQFDRFLGCSESVELRSSKHHQDAFLDAGRWIVRECDWIIAVWDGKPAEGRGGTEDIVEYARSLGKPVHHINPLKRIEMDR